jgi:hypothetical protein
MSLFDTIDIPGHERTLQPLRAIVEEYRRDCWTTGEYMPKILQLSQFYTAGDAERLLNRAADRPLRPGKQKPPHRSS